MEKARQVKEGIEGILTKVAKQSERALLSKPPILNHFDLCKKSKKFDDYYEIDWHKPIDRVRYAHAYPARHKETGEYRSVQILPKKAVPVLFFEKEIEVFRNLCHPNLITLYETFEDRQNWYYITDPTDRSNLYQAIPRIFPNPRDFDETQVALIVRTILKTLEYCHKRGITHSNLSYECILVNAPKGLKTLMVAGFGKARLQHEFREYTEKKSDLDDSSSEKDDKSDHKNANQKMARDDLFAAPETRCGDLSIYDEPASDLW
mgnify:CR=1 FL=1